jgi:hypothetical protein
MIHFDAKHQKSEAKRKVKQAKIKLKNRSEIMRIILNFASFEAKKFSPLFCFEAKITKSKQSEKFKAKKAKK